MKRGGDNGNPLLKNIPCLLAICEWVSKKIDEQNTPLAMTFTIELLKELFYKGDRNKKDCNPNGRAGKPKSPVKRIREGSNCPTIINTDMEDQMNW